MSEYLNNDAKTNFFPDAGNVFSQFYVNDPSWIIPQNGDGWVWRVTGANETSWSAEDALYEMINYFETFLYGVLEMKSDNMFDLIDQTNNQIFREL